MSSQSITLTEILKGASNKVHNLEPGTQKQQKEYFVTIQNDSLLFTLESSTSTGKLLGVLHASPGRLVFKPRIPRTHHIPASLKHRRYTLAKSQAVEIVPVKGHLPCSTLNEGDCVRFDCYATVEVDRIPILEDGEAVATDRVTTPSSGKIMTLDPLLEPNTNGPCVLEEDKDMAGSTLPDSTPTRPQDVIQETPASRTAARFESKESQGVNFSNTNVEDGSLVDQASEPRPDAIRNTKESQDEGEVNFNLEDSDKSSKGTFYNIPITNDTSQASTPEYLQGNGVVPSDPVTELIGSSQVCDEDVDMPDNHVESPLDGMKEQEQGQDLHVSRKEGGETESAYKQKSVSHPLPDQPSNIPAPQEFAATFDATEDQTNRDGTTELARTRTSILQGSVYASTSTKCTVQVVIPAPEDKEHGEDQGEDSDGVIPSATTGKDGAGDGGLHSSPGSPTLYQNSAPGNRGRDESEKANAPSDSTRGRKRKAPSDEVPQTANAGSKKKLKSSPTVVGRDDQPSMVSPRSTRAKRSQVSLSATPIESQTTLQSANRSVAATEKDYEGSANPRVLFSNTESDKHPERMKLLKSHGGKKVDTTRRDGFDLLVVGMGELRKTSKLLFAAIYGKPIVTEEWLINSAKAQRLLSIDSFLLINPDVTIGIDRSKLFTGKIVYITPSLKKEYGNAFRDIVEITKLCGATGVESKPARGLEKDENMIVIASQHNDPDRAVLMDKGIDCFTKELLSCSVLMGHLATDDDEFKMDPAASQSSKYSSGKRRR